MPPNVNLLVQKTAWVPGHADLSRLPVAEGVFMLCQEFQRASEKDIAQWLSVLFFLGCLTSSAFGQPVQGTLEKIKSAKAITMGYREASLAFSYVGDDKKPVGYAIDLCTHIAAGIQQQLGLNDPEVTQER